MRLHSVFLLCLCLLLVCSLLAEGKKKKETGKDNKNSNKKAKGKWTCDKKAGKYKHKTTAENMGNGLKVSCKGKSNITDLSLVGHNGTCQGLTPHLFVQMNKCFWKKDCAFSYNTQSLGNYMLKLYKGTPDCVIKSPDTFTLTYYCSHKRAKLFDLPRKPNQTIKEKEGILRSHPDHPWLYKKTKLPETLTLARPGTKKSSKFLAFTIRSLRLETGERLNVQGFDDEGKPMANPISKTGEVSLEDDVKSRSFNIGNNPNTVSIAIKTAGNTNGSEGFVLCFKWVKKLPKKGLDACRKLMKPQKCKAKNG